MQMILITFGLMAVLMLAMAVGVIFRGKPLRGSCGGVGTDDCECERAGTPGACEDEEVGPGEPPPSRPGGGGVLLNG